jgi:hypothetical protein
VGVYIEGYNQMTFSDNVLLAAVAVVVLGLNVGVIFWGYRKYRRNRLSFKKDRKTKLLTYTEVATQHCMFLVIRCCCIFKSCFIL